MSILAKLVKIGSIEGEDENVVLRRQFMIYQGLGMSIGGVLWGTLLVFFGYHYPAITPYSYVLITAFNFWLFAKVKSFALARNLQTVISMFLPFILQWTLGGFVVSGGVMLWSILAMVLSISYQNLKTSLVWLLIYIGLTVISFWFDDFFKAQFDMGVSDNVSKIFQISNVVVVSIIILLLFVYFVTVNSKNMERVKQTYGKLITAEKLAALGQVAAGVAHEVNTPLGAIKSSAEESMHAFHDVLDEMIWMSTNFTAEERDIFFSYLVHVQTSQESLSTKEEREIKKAMRERFSELGIENSHFLSDRLVQVGILEVGDELATLANQPHFEKMVMMLYNVLNQQRSNQTIQLAVDKASRVVKALKTYLHSSSGEEMKSTNIRDNIETVLTIYQNRLKQGVKVIKNYADVPEILSHADQLNQVWTNLIVNAVQAMDNKGILTIGIQQLGDQVEVTFKDSGSGIPLDVQSKIFDPFFTTKGSGEGSGLGLHIIKRILEEHHATITFESVQGEGTTFFVRLPILKPV